MDELKLHFAPLANVGRVDLWVDTRIDPGGRWRNEIDRAMAAAQVAILLVSPHFLASEFVTSTELPRLLEAADSRDVPILSVIVNPCLFTRVPELARFQAVNDPARSLAEMDDPERHRVWLRVAELVDDLVGSRPEQQETSPASPSEGPVARTATDGFRGRLNVAIRSVEAAARRMGIDVKRVRGAQRPRLLVRVADIDYGIYVMPGIPRLHWVQLASVACSTLASESGSPVRAVLALDVHPGLRMQKLATDEGVDLMWQEGGDWVKPPWDTGE